MEQGWKKGATWVLRGGVVLVCLAAIRAFLVPVKPSEKPRSPEEILDFRKGVLTIPSDLIQVIHEQEDIFPGGNYWLVQRSETGERCLLGGARLLSFSEERFVWELALPASWNNRFRRFASARAYQVRFEARARKDSSLAHLSACRDWIRAEGV